jgi:hypothetical protein
MSTLPIYVWFLVFAGLVAAIATASVMLYGGARDAGVRSRAATTAAAVFVVGGATWALLNIVLARADLYRFESGKARPLLAVMMVVTFAGTLLASRSPVASRVLAHPNSLWRLTFSQYFRVLGVTFLLTMALGKLPAGFAIPAGLGDIAIGVEAMVLARALRRGVTGRRRLVWFNVLGLVDLVVAIGIGVMAAPGVAHVLQLSPSTVRLSLLPFALIPTTLVPFAAALHVLSLRRIAVSRRAADSGALTTAHKVAA